MAKKSRMKKGRIKFKRNLNKRQKHLIVVSLQAGPTLGAPMTMKRLNRNGKKMLAQTMDRINRLFKREGEKGVRRYYKKFGPPTEGLNNWGETVPMGWAIADREEVVFYIDHHMVSDGNGGFICRDCQRGYFECNCSARDYHPSLSLISRKSAERLARLPRSPLGSQQYKATSVKPATMNI